MHKKRGQLTVFMILGLLLLIVAMIILSIYSEIGVKEEISEGIITHEIATDPIQINFQDCLEEKLMDGVYRIAFYGGYLYPSGVEKYAELGSGDNWYNYYYYNGVELPFPLDEKVKRLRAKEKMEEMISNYLLVETKSCISRLKLFEEQGFTFTYPDLASLEVSASVLMKDEKVFFTLNFPLTVIRGESVTRFEIFQLDVDLRLGTLYDTANTILTDIKDSQQLDISQGCNRYKDDSVNIYLESNDRTFEYVLRIIDAHPLSRGNLPLVFQFAIKNVDVVGECSG